MWDQLIQEHAEQMNAIEQEMLAAHEDESRRYDEEVDRLETPKTKFSKDVLSMRHFLEKLIGAKRYSEAEAMTKRLEIQVRHLKFVLVLIFSIGTKRSWKMGNSIQRKIRQKKAIVIQ